MLMNGTRPETVFFKDHMYRLQSHKIYMIKKRIDNPILTDKKCIESINKAAVKVRKKN